MELSEIMRRIRLGDREALKELIARYGGGVYKRALAKTGDKALAKEITQKTFAELVTMLQKSGDDEGWQLWLDTLAGRNIDTLARMKSDVSYVKNELERELYEPERPAPAVQQPYAPRETYRAPSYERPAPRRQARPAPAQRRPQPARDDLWEPEKRRGGFGYGLGVLILILLCLLLLWAAAGICMNMGFLPRCDLGFSWFNANVFPFF